MVLDCALYRVIAVIYLIDGADMPVKSWYPRTRWCLLVTDGRGLMQVWVRVPLAAHSVGCCIFVDVDGHVATLAPISTHPTSFIGVIRARLGLR